MPLLSTMSLRDSKIFQLQSHKYLETHYLMFCVKAVIPVVK